MNDEPREQRSDYSASSLSGGQTEIEAGTAMWCFDMGTAPRDGTLLLLLIASNDDRENPMEDSDEATPTIGHNSRDNTGDDEWQFAGWNWENDYYTEGRGTPIAWRRITMEGCPTAPSAREASETASEPNKKDTAVRYREALAELVRRIREDNVHRKDRTYMLISWDDFEALLAHTAARALIGEDK